LIGELHREIREIREDLVFRKKGHEGNDDHEDHEKRIAVRRRFVFSSPSSPISLISL
jgi:hypothetical protein